MRTDSVSYNEHRYYVGKFSVKLFKMKRFLQSLSCHGCFDASSHIEFLIIVRTFESRFMCWEFAGWLTYVATRQLIIFSASFNSIWGWLCDSQQPYFVSVFFSDRFCKTYCSTVFWTFKTISLDLKAGFDVAENRTEHQTDVVAFCILKIITQSLSFRFFCLLSFLSRDL